MPLLNNYTDQANFWVLNPQFLIPQLFKDIYDADNSKDKSKSSKIMYALVFSVDPTEENKFANLEPNDRKKLLAKDFLKQPDFDWDYYKEHIQLLSNMILTPAQKSLANFYKELQERDEFLSTVGWDLDTGEKKDKMLANTSKLYATYQLILKQLEKESAESIDKGGSKPSGSDLGTM